MITSLKQANAVQARREEAGKRGVAKAVRRFHRWSSNNNNASERSK